MTLPPFRVLLSYAYHGGDLAAGLQVLEELHPVEVMVDSGAYTVKNQGRDLPVEEYGDWLLQHVHGRPQVACYANLDVIGDWEATQSNQEQLEAMGLSPTPVFHGGSPMHVLQDLCTRYPLVALGNLTATSDRDRLWPWLARCFTVAEEHGTRLHGFGLADRRALVEWPFWSIDSSSWGYGHRYGLLQLWDGRKLRQARLSQPQSIWRQAALLRRYGVDPHEMMDPDRYHHRITAGANAASWLRMAQDLARSRDLRVYLAEGTIVNLRYALEGWLRVEELQHA